MTGRGPHGVPAAAPPTAAALPPRPARPLPVALPTALLAALLAAALPGPPAAANEREAELEHLHEAIRESRERVAHYEKEERGLLETLEALDRSLSLLRRELDASERAAQESHARLAAVEGEREERSASLERTRRAMTARAVALYKAGEVGGVRLLFAADGLRELLARVAALRRLIRYDADLIARHRSQVAALSEAEAGARTAAEEHGAALARIREREAQLARERGARQQVVARLHADRRRERHALEELERAARAMEETLAALRSDPGPPAGGTGLASLRGRLPAPLEGGEVVQGFGRVVDSEFLTETFHKGIDLAAPFGTPVRAVAPGRVRFAGWFRGYGRIVILDHGDAYFSVSGHLAEIAPEVGATVAAGEAIGTVGDSGSLAGPRLYFELRRGAEPLDPREWIASLEGVE